MGAWLHNHFRAGTAQWLVIFQLASPDAKYWLVGTKRILFLWHFYRYGQEVLGGLLGCNYRTYWWRELRNSLSHSGETSVLAILLSNLAGLLGYNYQTHWWRELRNSSSHYDAVDLWFFKSKLRMQINCRLVGTQRILFLLKYCSYCLATLGA